MPYADLDVRREYQRQYKAANRERLRDQSRLWRKSRSAEDPEFRARERAATKRWRERNPDKVREANGRNRVKYAGVIRESTLKALYGITSNDYEKMYEEQNGCCAICGSPDPGGKKRFLCIDHDHDTGKVRGLLCDACNNGLGRFKDSVERLNKAIAYLEEG